MPRRSTNKPRRQSFAAGAAPQLLRLSSLSRVIDWVLLGSAGAERVLRSREASALQEVVAMWRSCTEQFGK